MRVYDACAYLGRLYRIIEDYDIIRLPRYPGKKLVKVHVNKKGEIIGWEIKKGKVEFFTEDSSLTINTLFTSLVESKVKG